MFARERGYDLIMKRAGDGRGYGNEPRETRAGLLIGVSTKLTLDVLLGKIPVDLPNLPATTIFGERQVVVAFSEPRKSAGVTSAAEATK